MSFKNKVIIVTGASSGIGAAAAVAFSNEGARVVIVGRNQTKLASVATLCVDPLVINADVTNDSDARRIINETIEKFGQLDILINNAGILTWGSLLSDNLMEAFDTVMNVNLRAAVYLTHLAAPHMIKTKGNIVNISSIGGVTTPGAPDLIGYCVSKAGLNHFGISAAAELAAHGIRVNTISPGPVKTDCLENCGVPGSWDSYRKRTALDRISEPTEIADLILFLASDKAKGITGSNYLSDNGMLLKRQ